MNTINLTLTLGAALNLLRNASIPHSVHDEIENSILSAFTNVSNGQSSLTLKSVPHGSKIRAIAAIRNNMGWGLRDSKDFVEIVMGKANYDHGHYDDDGRWINAVAYSGGRPNTLVGDIAKLSVVADMLKKQGCEVVMS